MKGAKGYINLIVGLCAFVAFLLLNLVVVEFAQQSFLGVFLSSGCMMLCWVMIRNAFAEQGLISGQKDSEVKATKKEHLITSNEISTYKADFCIWCEQKNKERLKQKRLAILSGSSLIYEEYFDDNGNFRDKEVPIPVEEVNKKLNKINQKRYKKDCKLLNKARFAYVAPYIAEEICAKEDVSSRKKVFGVSVRTWKNVKIISSIIMSLVISVMLSFIKTGGRVLSQNEIIILVFELLIMAGSAFAFYFSALNFICGDWREGLIQKTRVMEEFYRNVVGTITYENDIQQVDGSIVVGKKIFTKRNDYKPLIRERDERTNQRQDEKVMAVAEKECAKQGNAAVGDYSGVNILVASDSNGGVSHVNQPVVLDSYECDTSILGRTIYTSSAVTDRASDSVEEDTGDGQEEAEAEK